MTRSKDRQQARLKKKLVPGYPGFRGHDPTPVPRPELKSLACTVCGHIRNVPVDTEEEGFVCSRCRQSGDAG